MTVRKTLQPWQMFLSAIAALALLAACGSPEDPGGPVPSVDSVTIAGDQAIALEVGDTVQLDATVEVTGGASTDVTWSSGDESVAAVAADGTVTALATGTAVVTATSVADTSVSDSVSVLVVGEGGAVVIGQGENLTLTVGETETLTVTVVGEGLSQDVSFVSGDETVVAVAADGTVTGVAEGTTTVTVTSDDDPSLSDQISVEVVADTGTPGDGVESVTIPGPGVVNLPDVGDTHQLEADVTVTGDASSDVSWSSGDESVATVDASGLVTAVSDGTAQITATSVEDPSVSDSVTVVVGEMPEFEVVSDEDYDPYFLEGRTPDEPIEGTLRYVLDNAPAGSVITFADDIDEVTLFGVDALSVPADGGGSTYADAHLILREDVTIQDAEGVTITAVSAFQPGDPGDEITYHSRVLYVPAGVSATLDGITLQGGGFIVNGGGIHNAGTLTLRDSTVTGNHAYSNGGGIYNTGTLTVEDSEISGNFAVTYDDEEGAAIDIRGDFDTGDPGSADLVLSDGGYGGAIYNDGDGTVTITGSTLADNEANYSGGAIYDVGASVSVSGSTIEGNLADPIVSDPGRTDRTDSGPNYAGGVYTAGDLTVTATDFLSNEAFQLGGGFYLDEIGVAELDDVFFDGNAADFGGGIFHEHAGDPTNLTPSDPEASAAVTFGTNVATDDGDDYYASDTTVGSITGQSTDEQALPRRGDVPMGR